MFFILSQTVPLLVMLFVGADIACTDSCCLDDWCASARRSVYFMSISMVASSVSDITLRTSGVKHCSNIFCTCLILCASQYRNRFLEVVLVLKFHATFVWCHVTGWFRGSRSLEARTYDDGMNTFSSVDTRESYVISAGCVWGHGAIVWNTDLGAASSA